MSIVTKRGDSGATDLLYGGRVSKDHLLIQTVGDINELSAILGLAKGDFVGETWLALNNIQSLLITIMGEITCSHRTRYQKEYENHLKESDLEKLDKECDRIEKEYGPFTGWTTPESFIDLAVTVCRRTERTLVSLIKYEQKNFSRLSPMIPEDRTPELNYLRKNSKLRTIFAQYFNRLSDYLWLLARTL